MMEKPQAPTPVGKSWLKPLVPVLVVIWGAVAWHTVTSGEAGLSRFRGKSTRDSASQSTITANAVYRAVNGCISFGWGKNDASKVLFYECAEGGFTASDVLAHRATRVYTSTAKRLNQMGCVLRKEEEAMDSMSLISCPGGMLPSFMGDVGPYTNELGTTTRLEDCRPVAWSHPKALSIGASDSSTEGSPSAPVSGQPEPVLLSCGGGLLNQTYLTPLQRDAMLAERKSKANGAGTRYPRLPALQPNDNLHLPRPPQLTDADKAAVAETLAY